MWVGWNASLIGNFELDAQKVWYLPQINQSPTSSAVVLETMKRSQRLAEECGKDSIAVTYGIAIAKLAMQIQAEEAPLYGGIPYWNGIFQCNWKIYRRVRSSIHFNWKWDTGWWVFKRFHQRKKLQSMQTLTWVAQCCPIHVTLWTIPPPARCSALKYKKWCC